MPLPQSIHAPLLYCLTHTHTHIPHPSPPPHISLCSRSAASAGLPRSTKERFVANHAPGAAGPRAAGVAQAAPRGGGELRGPKTIWGRTPLPRPPSQPPLPPHLPAVRHHPPQRSCLPSYYPTRPPTLHSRPPTHPPTHPYSHNHLLLPAPMPAHHTDYLPTPSGPHSAWK